MPATGFPVSQDMVLVVTAYTIYQNANLFVDVMMRTPAGHLQASRLIVGTVTPAAVLQVPLPLLAGELVSFAVRTSINAYSGQTYVMADLAFNSSGGQIIVGRLCQGSVSLISQIAWTAESGAFPTGQGPFTLDLLTADPAVNTAVTIGPFVGPVRLWAAKVHLATSATVANRTPVLSIFDSGGSLMISYPATQVVPASTGSDISWSVSGAPQLSSNVIIAAAMAPIYMGPLCTATVSVLAMAAADQLSACHFQLECLPQSISF